MASFFGLNQSLLHLFVSFSVVLLKNFIDAGAADSLHPTESFNPMVDQSSRTKYNLINDGGGLDRHHKVVELFFESPVFQSEDLELECTFRLNKNQKLYSIKWYKDGEEFFQYMPNDYPKVQHYNNKIIMEQPEYEIGDDNTFRLLLKNVNINFQGIYGCELSTDAPEFMTFKDYRPLEVYVLPNKSPKIISGNQKLNFLLKSRIDLNCTSPKSRPVSMLQWFINDQPAPNDYLIHYNQVNHSDGLQSKTVRLKFIVNEDHHQLGKMKLECVAIYQKLRLDHNVTILEHQSSKSTNTTSTGSKRIKPFWKSKHFYKENGGKIPDKNKTTSTNSSTSSLSLSSLSLFFWLLLWWPSVPFWLPNNHQI